MLRIIPHAAIAWFALCTCASSSAAATEAADGVDAYGRTSRYVRMRDGTRIAVDVLLPPTLPGAKPQRRPTLFRYSPYRRVVVDPATGKVVLNPDVRFFLDHGYAVVQADMRGTGASEGWTNQMDLAIRRDGRELVDWIDRQRWSNHRVGMFGGSYEGWAQLAVAAERPRALKAIAPAAAGFDDMLNRPGGILSYAFMQNWSALTYHLNHGTTFPAMPMTPSPPVEDEDGDGTVQDEVPVDLNGNGWFHDDYAATSRHGPAVRYADGIARRRNTYLNAIKQHARDGDGYTLSNTMRFRDTSRPGDGATIADLTWAMVPAIRKSKVAILTIGGWFDPFVRAGTQIYSTLAPTNPSRLLIYPTYHQGLSPKFAAAIAAPDRQAVRDAQLQWFDHWLKGIDNGAERAPPVHVFQMNAGWRDAGSWPLPHATTRIYQLGAGRRLVEGGDPMPASQDLYRADFTASSGWGPMIDTTSIAAVNRRLGRAAPVSATFSRNRQQMLGAPADIPDRTAADAKALIYTSDPLAGDLDVIGHPVVHLTVGSTSDDIDLFFYLEDVAPDGTATLVTEYQHRAGFSRLRDNRSTIPHNPGIVVAPQLPWHGYDRKDYDAAPFAGGRKVEIVSDLYPTAWRFRAGHRLRLSITCADWPTFELHPALSPSNRPDDPANIVPTITMELGGITMSRIELPIAPGA